MEKFKRKKRYWVTVVSLVGFYYLFTFGPLFAWNPLKVGYDTFDSQTFSVSYPEETALPSFYQGLEQYLTQTSKTFDLPLISHMKIIRCDKAKLRGYLPWMKTDGLGGVALHTGDVLYINYEKIAEMGYSEEEYVKHEVVHLMHHQHTNIINADRAGKVTYLAEGIPFYAGGPKFYSREEFLTRLKQAKLQETTEGDEVYVADAFAALDEKSADRYKISHMLYGEFIHYLIKKYGQEKFNAFNHEFLKTPSIHRTLFEEHYGKKLEVALQEFETTLE